MKRIFGAVVLTLLVGLYYSVYAIDAVKKPVKGVLRDLRSNISRLYHSFADFCYDIGGRISSNHLGLDSRMWSLIGIAICVIVFFIIYFVVFGIIARITRKRKIEKKLDEGETNYEPSKFPAKRLLFAVLILALVAYAACIYAVPAVNTATKQFLHRVRVISFRTYHTFEDFCYKSVGVISKDFQASLSKEVWTGIFLGVIWVIFLILWFVIFGLIARSQKRKHAKKVQTYQERMGVIPVKAKEVKEPAPAKETTEETEEPVVEQPVKRPYRPLKQFYWQDYIGGRPVKRVIFAIIISIVLVAFLVLRFFSYFNTDTTYSVEALKSIFVFFEPVFKIMDQVMTTLFSFGESTVIMGSLLNKQPFSLMQLLDLVLWLVASAVIVAIFVLICTMFVHMFRKSFAKRRAKKAEDAFWASISENPQEERLYASEKASEQLGIPTAKTEGADIAAIASISPDKLQASMGDDGKSSEYVDDIAEGVTFIGIAEPLPDDSITIHETREPLTEEKLPGDETVSNASNISISELQTIDEEKEDGYEHVINLYHPDVDVDINSCDVATISAKQNTVEELDTNDISDVVRFDDDGFAYLESLGPRQRSSEAAKAEGQEEIPETYDFIDGRSFDSSKLVDELVTSNVIIEPEFTRSKLPMEDTLVLPVNCENIPYDINWAIEETDEDKDILNALEPYNLKPIDNWPSEISTEITDNGALHILLDSEDTAVLFGDGAVRFAPVIEEVTTETIEDEKPQEKPVAPVRPVIAPLHPINTHRQPIKPIEVAPKEEEVVEEEEEKPQIRIVKPLHDINDRRTDIAPVAIDSRRRFDLKRFNVGHRYNGRLSSTEAFEKGVTNVAPTVAPVTIGNNDSKKPEWLRRKHEEAIKSEGYANLQTKEIDEVDPHAVVAKPQKVETFTLRRSRKKEEPVVEEVKPVDENEPKVVKPQAPIAPIKPVVAEKEPEPVEEKPAVKVVPIRKPLAPIKKPEGPVTQVVIKPLVPKKVNSTVEKAEVTKPAKPLAPIKKPKH